MKADYSATIRQQPRAETARRGAEPLIRRLTGGADRSQAVVCQAPQVAVPGQRGRQKAIARATMEIGHSVWRRPLL